MLKGWGIAVLLALQVGSVSPTQPVVLAPHGTWTVKTLTLSTGSDHYISFPCAVQKAVATPLLFASACDPLSADRMVLHGTGWDHFQVCREVEGHEECALLVQAFQEPHP